MPAPTLDQTGQQLNGQQTQQTITAGQQGTFPGANQQNSGMGQQPNTMTPETGAQYGPIDASPQAADRTLKQIEALLRSQPGAQQTQTPSLLPQTTVPLQPTGVYPVNGAQQFPTNFSANQQSPDAGISPDNLQARMDIIGDQPDMGTMGGQPGMDMQMGTTSPQTDNTDAFTAMGQMLQNSFTSTPVMNSVTGQQESSLPIALVTAGKYKPDSSGFIVLSDNSFGEDDDKQQTMKITVTGQRLLEFDKKSMNKAILSGLGNVFSNVTLKDGSSLTDHLELANSMTTQKEDMATLQSALANIVQSNPGQFAPAEQALLMGWNGYDTSDENRVWRDTSIAADDQGRIKLEFSLSDWSGKLEDDLKMNDTPVSVGARIEANINARKADILQRIKTAAVAINQLQAQQNASSGQNYPPLFSDTDLANLDFIVTTTGDDYGSGTTISVTLGNKLQQPSGNKPEDGFGATNFGLLSKENMQMAVQNAFLYSGQDADKFAMLVADTENIRSLLEQKRNIPGIGHLLDSNNILLTCKKAKERSKNTNKVTINEPALVQDIVAAGSGLMSFDVLVPLPDKVSVQDVVASALNLRDLRQAQPQLPYQTQMTAEANAMNQLLNIQQNTPQQSPGPVLAGADAQSNVQNVQLANMN